MSNIATPPAVGSAIEPNSARPKVLLGNIFRMKFKFKGMVSEKYFMFTGTPREATQRAQRHCMLQGYSQHIWTEPFIHDLDAEDKAVQEGGLLNG